MSQLSFLEAVISWDEEQCRQHAAEALPRLASFLQKSEDVQEQIGITKVICMSLLPWIQLQEAHSQVFAPLTSKSSAMLESILQSVQILVKESQAEILTTLEMLVELVDCFVCCVKFVQDRATATVELCHTSDLVMSALAVLKGTYGHCKDSGELYGDLLSGVTEVLFELFKKAHSLQVAVLSLLEKVTVGEHVTNQEEEHLLAICQGLFDLCGVVTSLDTKLVLGLWKTLSRFSVRHKEHVCGGGGCHGNGGLDLDAMVGQLCGEVGGAFRQACQLAPKETDMEELALSQGDVAAFQRALKVAGYQMKILTYMLDNFAESTDNSQLDILKLIFLIHRSLPPSLVAPPIQQTHVRDLQRHVSNAVEPLISLMVGHDTFTRAVLAASNDIVGDDWFPFLRLLTRVIDCLPDKTVEVQDRWLGCGDGNRAGREGNTLLDCLFTAVEQCYVELCAPVMLPGVVCGGRSEHEVSLYEYVCTHLCGLLGCFPARHFASLEVCLLANVFSVNSFVSSLASDAWCYMARFGTAELCYGHTELLIQAYLGLEGKVLGSGRPMVTLMRRLVKFLAPQHQTTLLKRFPASSHMGLWKVLPISVFPESCQREVLTALWGQMDTQVRQFLNSTSNTYGDVDNLTLSIESLNIFLEGQDPTPTPGFLDTHGQLWSAVGEAGRTDRYLRSLLAEMTTLAAHLVPHLQEQDVLKTLQLLPARPEDSHMKLSLISFLLKISKLHFSPSPELQPTMSRVPGLFHALMTDADPVVRHRALESFTQFAEVTPYESLVPQCLNDSERLQEMVVTFLNKTPHSHPGLDTLEYLRQQLGALLGASRRDLNQEASLGNHDGGNHDDGNHDDGNRDDGNHGDMLDEIGVVEEPVSKRKRTDDTDTGQGIQQIVADMMRNVAKLEKITRAVEEVSEADKDDLKYLKYQLEQLVEGL